jgi:hypothetical protein
LYDDDDDDDKEYKENDSEIGKVFYESLRERERCM